MLTKKAFNREAVLRTYGDIRRGGRVPDQELDQVASWLKLSGDCPPARRRCCGCAMPSTSRCSTSGGRETTCG